MATATAGSVPLTGDPRIDGLTEGGSWTFGGGAHVLTYSFSTGPGTDPWTPELQSAFTSALAAWEAVAKIDFQLVSDTGDFRTSPADLALVLHAYGPGPGNYTAWPDPTFDDYNQSNAQDVTGESSTSATYPASEGDIFFNSGNNSIDYLQPGGYGYQTILGQIGLALGLKSPESNVNGRPTFNDLGIDDLDTNSQTVEHDPARVLGNPSTPMLLDVLAIQQIYGANMSYHTGNNTYAAPAGDPTNPTLSAIWDAGGTDTLDFSKVNSIDGTVIDLHAGAFSSLGHQLDGFTLVPLGEIGIDYNVTIENAIGSALGDTITGNDGANTLHGGDGNDVIDGQAGADTIYGEQGDDQLEGGKGTDTLSGGGGSDVIDGGDGNDTLSGGAGNDSLTGGIGNDALNGGDGDDSLDGGVGNDTMTGGAGNDVYMVDSLADKVVESGGGGIDTIVSTIVLPGTVAGVENYTFNIAAGVTFTGDGADNAITGFTGSDHLDGGTGNDVLDGGAGNDDLTGGAGNDVFILDRAKDVVHEDVDGGTDEVRVSFALTAAIANVENYTYTGTGAFKFTGNTLDNVIRGGAEADVLAGGAGNDTLLGGAGNDTLTGGKGNDTLDGGSGKDKLDGGDNDDTLVVHDLNFASVLGGAGTDTLRTIGGDFEITLAQLAGTKLKDIERIDLSQSGLDQLTLNQTAVHNASSNSNQLIVDGNQGDVVHIGAAFVHQGTQVADGETYELYKAGGDTVLIDQAIAVNPPAPLSEFNLADLTATTGFRVDGSQYSGAGATVSAAGDINGDGFDDVLVANVSSYSGPYSNHPTTAYVVFGNGQGTNATALEDLDGTNGFKLTSPVDHADFPAMLSSGDFNGDGYADVLVGAGNSNYLVFGHKGPFDAATDLSTLDGSDGFRIDLGKNGYQLATSWAGDVNGDGFDDVLIGKHESSGGFSVVFGHAGNSAPVVEAGDLTGDTGFSRYGGDAGYSVAGAGDVNGDGFGDFIVGAPDFQMGGGAFLVFGHDNSAGWTNLIDAKDTVQIISVQSQENAGVRVSGAGDFNGDGYDDVVLASTNTNESFVVFGHGGTFDSDLFIETLNGQNTLDGSNGFTITAPDPASMRFVTSVGDFNGDGYDDLLIDSPITGDSQQGAAYLVYGSAGGFGSSIDLGALDGYNGFKIDGAAAGDNAGSSVAAAGDVNGDGYDDVIIGAPNADPNGANGAGSAYILYGHDTRHQVTHQGGTGDDVLTGTAAADVMIGGQGNDVLSGAGGADVIRGGSGNDQIHVTDGSFHQIDGGAGTDTLHLDFGGAIDFGNIDGQAATSDRGKISGIERLSVDNGTANALTLHAADVLDLDASNHDVGSVAKLDNLLKIDGNHGDTLALSAADHWSAADTGSLAGYAVYTAGAVKIAVDTDITVSTT